MLREVQRSAGRNKIQNRETKKKGIPNQWHTYNKKNSEQKLQTRVKRISAFEFFCALYEMHLIYVILVLQKNYIHVQIYDIIFLMHIKSQLKKIGYILFFFLLLMEDCG